VASLRWFPVYKKAGLFWGRKKKKSSLIGLHSDHPMSNASSHPYSSEPVRSAICGRAICGRSSQKLHWRVGWALARQRLHHSRCLEFASVLGLPMYSKNQADRRTRFRESNNVTDARRGQIFGLAQIQGPFVSVRTTEEDSHKKGPGLGPSNGGDV
jgi:hypothetical protein